MSGKSKKGILFVGPLPNENSNFIGGAKVSFKILTEYLAREKVLCDVINFDKYQRTGFGLLKNIASLLKNFCAKITNAKVVMLNFSQSGSKYLAPLLYVIARAFGRKIAFRMFGGDMKVIFNNSKYARWIWKRTLLNSDLILLQTKELIHYFSKYSENIEWLPTSRTPVGNVNVEKPDSFEKKFVFISQVKDTKGIGLILQAREELGESYQFHIYGPIHQDKYKFLENNSDLYKGVLKPEMVIPTLSRYNVLMLPTHHPGEGYPGIIIESYSQGIPVITTCWNSIPEIVENETTGILINPKSKDELVSAIEKFNSENYAAYSNAALRKFKEFDADIINKKLVQKLESL